MNHDVKDPHLVETFGPLPPRILVLGHGGHGKGTFCEMLQRLYGLHSMSSSRAALPYIFPALQAAASYRWDTPEHAYEDRSQHRDLWKALISLLNSPDKTTLSRLILSEVPVYDGMRCAEEFKASRHLFDRIYWIDASERVGPDSSMGIERTDDMVVIPNNGSEIEFYGRVVALNLGRTIKPHRSGGGHAGG